ncbi:MAG: peroxiredoxin family protein [Anaerolineae bacterium]|nr:MAG: peroxiredoxin family protein [Anaerolineae bacterium]
MQRNYAQFEARNAEIVALVVEPQARVQALIQAYGFPYPVLADADHAVSSAYGVYNLLNDNRAAPSVFVVDEDGTTVWAYVGQNTSDRPSTQAILNQIP